MGCGCGKEKSSKQARQAERIRQERRRLERQGKTMPESNRERRERVRAK